MRQPVSNDPDAKTSRWAFTAFKGQWSLFEVMPELIAEWGWQTEECPDTKNLHYQGYIRTKRQVRFNQLHTVLPGVRLSAAINWAALLNYCKKKETAISGTQVHQVSTSMSLSMADALILMARNMPYIQPLTLEQWSEDLHKKRLDNEFWTIVNDILLQKPNTVALWTQPQYYRAWVNTRKTWIALCLESPDIDETDSQTDTLPNNSFLTE